MSTAEMAGADLSRARAMIDVRHYAEASALLARLLAVEPSCEGWCLMATARLGAGDHAGAIEAANKAIPIDPENGWPHRLASSAFFHLSHFPESLKAALRARRLESGQWQSAVLVAQAAVGTGDLKQAAEASAEALRLAPHEPDALYVAGRVCRARSDYEQAEAHFHRALAEDPQHAGALNELGKLELAGHNPVRAVRMFARAAAAAPQSPVSARNAELAVIRAAAGAIYVMVAVGGTAEVICAGLKFPMAGPLAVTWVIVGCLLALAGWRITPATRQLIVRLARRRRAAVPIGIIAAGATIALISIPVIINSMEETEASSLPIPYATPVVVIGVSRIVATAVWRKWR